MQTKHVRKLSISHYRNVEFRKEPVDKNQVKIKTLLIQILMKWTHMSTN